MKQRNRTNRSFVIMLFVVFSLGLFCEPLVVSAGNTGIYAKVESFTWKEYGDNGSQLLKESGPIYAVGGSVSPDTVGSLVLRAKGELFIGTVDYDGQTQSGRPVETDTDYTGLKAEGDLGWRITETDDCSLEPFVGLGYRRWQRDIQDTVGAIGYEETWRSLYSRLGIRGEYTGSGQLTAFAEAGVKMPLSTENKVDLSVMGLPTVTLRPGNEASAFAETGLKWIRFKASLFYEGMRFSKSHPVIVSNVRVWQPESKADIFGINVGMDF